MSLVEQMVSIINIIVDRYNIIHFPSINFHIHSPAKFNSCFFKYESNWNKILNESPQIPDIEIWKIRSCHNIVYILIIIIMGHIFLNIGKYTMKNKSKNIKLPVIWYNLFTNTSQKETFLSKNFYMFNIINESYRLWSELSVCKNNYEKQIVCFNIISNFDPYHKAK